MKTPLPFAPLLLAVLALGACGGDDVADALNIGAPRARLINAMPDGPNLQLYRNETLQSDAGSPGYEQSSKYFDTVTATSTWSVRSTASGASFGSTSMRAAGSTRYTLIAFQGAGMQADLVPISDPYDVALGTDKARVRIVNAATASGTLDVYLSTPGAALASLTPISPNLRFEGVGPASGSNAYGMDAGLHELRLTVAGTRTVLFDGTLAAGVGDDLLLLVLPASTGTGGIKVLEIPSAGDQSNSEIPGV